MPLEWKAPAGLFGDPKDVRDVFRTIYDRNVWGGGSGAGSSPQLARVYMSLLQTFLDHNAIQSVVDIGCGDWQFSRYLNWGQRQYRGVDVVESVIETNQKHFAKPNITFEYANPAEDGFEASGDLLLIKDVLQHLSNENVMRLLRLAKHFRFTLITNAFATENVDCENGDTRPLDIRLPPFGVTHAAVVLRFAEKATFLVVNTDA